MHIETEHKFLTVSDAFLQQAVRKMEICQAYLCRESGKTVRIRLCDDKAFLTIKGPSLDGGLSRFEWETEVAPDDAALMLDLCGSERIDKTRYLVPCGKLMFEVDVFHGANEGLVVAELEVPDAGTAFERPDWLGQEVTGQRRYYNATLINSPYSSWK